MSRGTQPYCEFPNIAEVAEQIKSGYKMSCPDGCRPEVHEQVMLPCWQSQARNRPGFAALCQKLESLGATPLEVQRERVFDSQQESSLLYHINEHVSDAEWQAELENHDLRAPTVHHIAAVFAHEVIAAVQPPWRDKHGNLVTPPESATISDAMRAYGKPISAAVTCPRDGQLGCAYVDVLTSRDDTGRAVALLSCALFSSPTPILAVELVTHILASLSHEIISCRGFNCCCVVVVSATAQRSQSDSNALTCANALTPRSNLHNSPCRLQIFK